ncbi:MAG TPA: DUF4386 domain-containing protein [Microlunatus sp.]
MEHPHLAVREELRAPIAAAPPATVRLPDHRSRRRASLTAGVALALMAALAGFAVFGVIAPLITDADAITTAQNIAASPSLFRLGIACLIVVVLLDVIVAVSLFTVFSGTDPMIAGLAAAFRIAYAAVYLVAIAQLVLAVRWVDDPDLALRAIDTYSTIWDVALILFAAHLLLIGLLAWRSGFMPKIFGVLLALSGLGYLVDGFGSVLQGDVFGVGRFTFVGEVALIFWLLIRGRRSDFRPNDDRGQDRDRGALASAGGATL